MSDIQADTYRSYLVRLWRTDETAPWRASLNNPNTGKTVYFTDIETLCAFLVRPDLHDMDGIAEDEMK